MAHAPSCLRSLLGRGDRELCGELLSLSPYRYDREERVGCPRSERATKHPPTKTSNMLKRVVILPRANDPSMVSDRSKDRSLGLGISCMAGHMVAVGDHRRMTQKGSFAITFTAQLIHSTVQRQSRSRRDGVLNHISGTCERKR